MRVHKGTIHPCGPDTLTTSILNCWLKGHLLLLRQRKGTLGAFYGALENIIEIKYKKQEMREIAYISV